MNRMHIEKTPKEIARSLPDTHVNKLFLEESQMLSTAHRLLDGELYHEISPKGKRVKRWRLEGAFEDNLYKAVHYNHPATKWARFSAQTYLWAFELAKELSREYSYRYGKVHGCAKLLPFLSCLPKNIKDSGWEDPPQCVYDECKSDNVIDAYRKYFKIRRNEITMRWTKREIPAWL